jgi:hypothetical protein
MDALRNSKKILPPSCSHSLFIHIFQFDFGCTSYVNKKLEGTLFLTCNTWCVKTTDNGIP